jgi:N-acetylglucosaminyldiphosphoundecaprenol N-acetyl-beta-D-mannosaminyltransferase
MNKYFNLCLDFNKVTAIKKIQHCISQKDKGYVCVIDGNVLACATKNSKYKDIINRGLVNICDGSSIAFLASKIHKQNFKTFTGPELFCDLVQQKYKQYFLGNTSENLLKLKKRFTELGYSIEQFHFEPLPFTSVGEFDYSSIALRIKEHSPDIIWVSLGAPKQELFIGNLYPYIERGVLVAIGAAFNIFLDEQESRRAPEFIRKIHLEWLFRTIKEPKRIGSRALKYLILLPELIISEIKKVKT